MPIVTRTSVSFRAARSGVQPATYGQRMMAGFVEEMGAEGYRINVFQRVAIPPGVDLDGVLAAIGELPLRHEALRTLFRRAGDGELWQELTADGEVPVELWNLVDEDPEPVGERAEQMLRQTRFDLAAGWPMRVLVGSLNQTPAAVLLVFSHVATDMSSARLVATDLADLLAARAAGRAAPTLPARRQPFDQARFEQSAEGRKRQERTMADWRQRLLAAPRTMCPQRPATPAQPPHWRGALSSRALAAAANTLAVRYRVGTSLVYLAAEAVLLAHHAGADRAAIEVSLPNRPLPELQWAVGNLTQTSLAVIDVTPADFATILRRTWSVWLRASRAGQYDYAAVRALRRQVEHARGIGFDIESFFNDLRPPARPDPARQVGPEKILSLVGDSTFAWTQRVSENLTKFLFQVDGEPDRTDISALVDTSFLPPEHTRDLLVGIERLLVWQATAPSPDADRPLSPEVVAEVTGVAAAQRPAGWVRVDGTWVEIAAVDELLRTVTTDLCGETRVAVVTEAGQERLVGHLVARDRQAPPSPEEIHRRCVAALVNPLTAEPQWLSAQTPHRYVVHAGGHQAGLDGSISHGVQLDSGDGR